MEDLLNFIQIHLYEPCHLKIEALKPGSEGKEYHACEFELNGSRIISRTARITPKKTGQFVTCWKRDKDGITTPFCEHDTFDYLVINIRKEDAFGQFVFPKSALIDKGIVSAREKEGKRGFRVYPAWDIPGNKQAEKTQKWQLDYFYQLEETTNTGTLFKLYSNSY